MKEVKYLSVYLDMQGYIFFFQMAGICLHSRNIYGINAISAWIQSRTHQTFNHKIKGKWKGELKL